MERSTEGPGGDEGEAPRRARPYLDPNDPASWAKALGTAPTAPEPDATTPDGAATARWSPAGTPIPPTVPTAPGGPPVPPGHVGPVFEPISTGAVRPTAPLGAPPPAAPPVTDHGGRLYLGPDGQMAPILPRPSKPSRSVGRLVAIWLVLLIAFIVLLLVSLSWAPPTPGG